MQELQVMILNVTAPAGKIWLKEVERAGQYDEAGGDQIMTIKCIIQEFNGEPHKGTNTHSHRKREREEEGVTGVGVRCWTPLEARGVNGK